MWHLGTMETGLDLASRETLLAIIAEQQGHLRTAPASREPGGPAVRRRAGARMPGHKPAASARSQAAEEKNPRRKRQQGFVRLRMDPTAQVTHAPEFCPECHTTLSRGLGAADPGGHRTSGVSCRSYRTRLHRPEVSVVPETEAAPGPPPGSGRGPTAVGDQPVSSTGQALVSPIAALREEGRLPIRTIQWYLQTVIN